MNTSTKRLLIVFVVLLGVLGVVVLRQNSGVSGGPAPVDLLSNLEQRAHAMASIDYNVYEAFKQQDMGADGGQYQAHGNLPVLGGPVMRANPFSAY